MRYLTAFENWLRDFKIERIIANKSATIDGRPLYGYQLTTQELENLKRIFSTYYRGLSLNNIKLNHYYGAAFVLLGSEFFRRQYESQWSWEAIYQFIGMRPIEDATERTNLVELGFEYWKLPKIEAEEGKKRDIFGSVLNQGGLPWRLVQDRDNALNKIIQYCFSNYTELIAEHGSLMPVIEKQAVERRLSDYLSNQSTFELISGVVETVVGFQRKYPDIAIVGDPFKYLSEKEPNWIYKFPLPLNEENAKGLIKGWFDDAKRQIDKGQKAKENIENYFIAENFWYEAFETDDLLSGLRTRVTQPNLLTLSFNKLLAQPASLRLELLIYEEERVLVKGLYFYAEIEDQKLLIKSRPGANKFLLRRRQPQKPLIVKLMSAGGAIYEEMIIGSSLSEKGLPLYFIKDEDHYKCVSDSGSFTTSHLKGYLYLPKGFTIKNAPEVLTEDGDLQINYRSLYEGEEASWIEVINSIDLIQDIRGETLELSYEANNCDPSKAIHLVGEEELTLKGSRYIYRTFPILKNAPEGSIEYVNGKILQRERQDKIVGNVNYQVKTRAGKTLLIRRFAVLPKSFEISIDAINLNRAELETRISLKEPLTRHTPVDFHFSVMDRHCDLQVIENSRNDFTIHILDPNKIPSDIYIAVDSSDHPEPLRLEIPLPIVGMRIEKDHFYLQENRLKLSLDEMIGHDIVLFDRESITEVKIKLQLHFERYRNGRIKLISEHILKPRSRQQRLNLISFKDEIERLMSIIDDLDAYVTMTISSPNLGKVDIILCKFHISGRVNYLTPLTSDFVVHLRGISEKDLGKIEFSWISLLDPSKLTPLTISRTEPSLNANEISLYFNEGLEGEALGLIISDSASELSLRPILKVNSKLLEKLSPAKGSVQYAVAHFNPSTNRTSFNDLFRLMQEDLEHPGWNYFKDLKNTIPKELSLSTFAAWKSLARNFELLTLAFFNLRLDVDFCHRMRNELSLIWEAIPYHLWQNSADQYSQYIQEKYFPEKSQQDFMPSLIRILADYNDRLKSILLADEITIKAIHGGSSRDLMTEDALSSIRIAKNRLVFDNDDKIWPTYLQDELIVWFNSEILERNLLSESFLNVLFAEKEPTYRYSFLLLPVYMAAVNTGVCKFGAIVNYQKSEEGREPSTEFEMLVELKFAWQQLESFSHDWYSTCYYHAVIEFMGWA